MHRNSHPKTSVSHDVQTSFSIQGNSTQSTDPGSDSSESLCYRKHIAAEVQRFLALAHFHARRRNLRQEDAEDCAMDFIVRILEEHAHSSSVKPSMPSTNSPSSREHPVMHWRAQNEARNFQRTVQRHADRFVSLSTISLTDADFDRSPSSLLPLEQILANEQQQSIMNALNNLDPFRRNLVIAHHIMGETIRELAVEYGLSIGAIEQILSRARKRLHIFLMEEAKRAAECDFEQMPEPVLRGEKQGNKTVKQTGRKKSAKNSEKTVRNDQVNDLILIGTHADALERLVQDNMDQAIPLRQETPKQNISASKE